MDRNPDINLDIETPTPGMFVLHGKQLMITARSAKIPYGIATKRTPCCNSHRRETVGIVLREEHRAAMLEGLEKKNLKNQKSRK